MKAIKAYFVMSTRWLLDGTWGWGLVASGANHVIRALELQSHPGPARRGLEVGSVTKG